MTPDEGTGSNTLVVRASCVAARCAGWLEHGASPGSWREAASRAWAAAARQRGIRRLDLPRNVRVIGVGSAVLGGAGKTPVSIELARDLATRGESVAFVGHAYLARPRYPRRVAPDDDVRTVGDDALLAARALSPLGVPVWVGPRRDLALAAAARSARTVVVDGLLQAAPDRLAHSVLVLDARAPFGSGQCPPAGDLRAAPADLLRCCDEIILVRDVLAPDHDLRRLPVAARPVRTAWIDIKGARDGQGRRLALQDLRAARLGLLTLVGRPRRVLESLSCRGVFAKCHFAGPDHRAPGPWDMRAIRNLSARFRLDGWLITPKCICHLASRDTGAPVWTLEVPARLDPSPVTVLESASCPPHVCSTSC